MDTPVIRVPPRFAACGREICTILGRYNAFVGTHFLSLLVALVLSVTLFIYVSKLKFTYEIEYNGLPWNRQTSLSTNDVIELFNNRVRDLKLDKVNCNSVAPYCTRDEDCRQVCEKSEGDFVCSHHSCVSSSGGGGGGGGGVKDCHIKKGGIAVTTLDGDSYCVCTKPKFYVGDTCDTLNPLLARYGTVSKAFDGRFNEEDAKYVICEDLGDADNVPISINGYIMCVDKKIVPYLKHLYDIS